MKIQNIDSKSYTELFDDIVPCVIFNKNNMLSSYCNNAFVQEIMNGDIPDSMLFSMTSIHSELPVLLADVIGNRGMVNKRSSLPLIEINNSCYLVVIEPVNTEVLSCEDWLVQFRHYDTLKLCQQSSNSRELRGQKPELPFCTVAEKLADVGSFQFGTELNFNCSKNCQRLMALSSVSSSVNIEVFLSSLNNIDQIRMLSRLTQLLKGEIDKVSERISVDVEGAERFLKVIVGRSPDELEKVLCIGTVINITDSVTSSAHIIELQNQLKQAQKMETIGQLTGGIAHDFNNILASIIGYNSLARSRIKSDNKVSSYLNEVAEAGDRARELVSQMLEFSHTRAKEPAPLNLARAVDGAIVMLKSMLPSSAQIHWSIRDSSHRDGDVLGSEVQIQQLVLNMVLNANDAISGIGNIEVSIDHKVVDNMTCSACGMDFRGEYSIVNVRDSGHGIDANALPRIFETFFSTKPKGKGSGLGLSIMNRIMHEYNGHIAVDSKHGQGTTMSLYFPVMHQIEFLPNLPDPTDDCHVLVVDDEITVLSYMREVLEINGYVVSTSFSVQQAKKILAEGNIDLLITDYSMPGMMGDELIKHVKEFYSDIPCLLCTGSINCPESARYLADLVICKPLRASHLLHQLSELRNLTKI